MNSEFLKLKQNKTNQHLNSIVDKKNHLVFYEN